jgi:hypothetical protein|tara:strand:+ start:754 stop:1257 length:504 start_codon:yes stop_codon:yes gene_type:complete
MMNKFFRTLPIALLMLFVGTAFAGHHKENDVAQAFTQIVGQTEAEQAALKVMYEFMASFNSRDVARWADTLLFPHIRVASGGVKVNPTKSGFIAETDLEEFARINNWHHSEWNSIETVQADSEKVHFKVRFTRFNPAGEAYVAFNSLYVLQKTDQGWGIRGRSSFAP